jgi:hypothetical protein
MGAVGAVGGGSNSGRSTVEPSGSAASLSSSPARGRIEGSQDRGSDGASWRIGRSGSAGADASAKSYPQFRQRSTSS